MAGFCFFVFFVRYLGFFWGGVDIWVLRDPTFSAKKNKTKQKKRPYRARQGHIQHVCKISGSNSQKRRGHLDFCAVKCKNHGLAL